MKTLFGAFLVGLAMYLTMGFAMDFEPMAALVGATCSATSYLIGKLLAARISATYSP
jgi:hypothetical protein